MLLLRGSKTIATIRFTRLLSGYRARRQPTRIGKTLLVSRAGIMPLRVPHSKQELRPSDTLAKYLHEIDSTPLLERNDEEELADRILEGDFSARDHLVRANLR